MTYISNEIYVNHFYLLVISLFDILLEENLSQRRAIARQINEMTVTGIFCTYLLTHFCGSNSSFDPQYCTVVQVVFSHRPNLLCPKKFELPREERLLLTVTLG